MYLIYKSKYQFLYLYKKIFSLKVMEEINNLYDEFEKCNNWNNKIELINKINLKINLEEDNINKKIESLDNITKITKKKINVDELIEEFNITNDLDKKILIYQNLNAFINKLNNDLFSS